jgi:transposase
MQEQGRPRVVQADRSQLELRPMDLDGLIPGEHPARALWAVVEQLDLSRFYEPIKAREHEPGRPAADPKVLLALWLYAISEGVGAARELERLCAEHHAYQWLRGGVPVNYHTLSDFRTGHGAAVDELLTQVLAVLLQQQLIGVTRVTQDGLRVRASAGTSSFRRRKRLKDYLRQARTQLEAVRAQAEEATSSARRRAAAERAARERADRLQRAVQELKKVQTQRAAQTGGNKSKSEPRASITDPTARRMRMGDGGYRPAYNVQLATETQAQVIVGVHVTNCGSDQGLAPPMLAEVERRTGQRPTEYLVDGGFTDKKTVEHYAARGVTLYGPVPVRAGNDPAVAQPKDSPAVREWRARMSTPAAREIYKERAATSERVNADLRVRRGLDRLLVRGINKVLCVALLTALTYNLLRWISVSPPPG